MKTSGKRGGIRRWFSAATEAVNATRPRPSILEGLESRVMLSLSAPTNLLANNGSTTSDIALSWNAVSGANSYQVWRSTSASANTATEIASTVTTTTFDDSAATDTSAPVIGTTYFYWVAAYNSSGPSAFSTIASATPGTQVFGDTFGSNGISSAWGAFNATDPNNGNVIYTNTTPSESSGSNPTTLAVVNDSQATNGQALAMSLTPAPGKNGYYDSAEICTEYDPSGAGNSLEYGEVTARIKIPGGNNSNAIWPAFWLLGDNITSVGWPNCGEIDVMENKGSVPQTIDSTLHGPANGGGDYNGGGGVGSTYTLSGGQDYYSAYHVFTVKWGPNSISFSVDGTTFSTLTPSSLGSGNNWVFNGHPFYIILDVCEGGQFAPGTITSTQTMDVDYVRAYSLPAPGGVTATMGTGSTKAAVNWNAVTGATSYEIWRNSSSNSATATELNGSVTGTSYTDNSSQANTVYYYWVVAGNSYQISNFSSTAVTKLASSVTLATSPGTVNYDGKTDVDSWAVATVHGVSGHPAPTGSATLTWYTGTMASGTPLSAAPTALGTYTVVANYAGDANYLPSQSGPQTVTITDPQGLTPSSGAQYAITWSGGIPTLDISAGTVTLSSDLSTTFANYVLTIENGAAVVLSSSQHVSNLALNGNATLDIGTGSVMINYGAGTDPDASVAAWVLSGYNGGAWNGTGIISTPAQTRPSYGVGFADSFDTGDPALLVTGTMEIMYTLLGDANLDGKVNGADFAIIASNFNTAATGWDQGDFNYDGKVNGADFAALAANFNQGVQTSVTVAATVAANPTSSVLTSTPASTSTSGSTSTSTSTQTGGSASTSIVSDVKARSGKAKPHHHRG